MATSDEVATVQPSGVLLRKDIRDLQIIAEGAAERCYKPASYDLRIGDDYIDPTDGEQNASLRPLQGKPIIIPPFGAIIVSTHEVVKIPGNVIGKFNLRIKMALRGIFVQMGTQVEPHYHGKLFAVLYNITSEPIELFTTESNDSTQDRRDRIFTIEFFNIGAIADNDDAQSERIIDIRKFVQNTKFSRSTIRSMLTDIIALRGEIKSIVENQTNSELNISNRLRQEFLGAFQAAKAQVDAAMAIGALKAETENERTKNLQDLVAANKSEIGIARTDFDARLKSIDDKRRHLWWGVVWGGIGLALATALIPVVLTLAVNYTRGWAEGDRGEFVLRDVIALRAQIENLSDRLDNGGQIDALNLEIDTLRRENVALRQQLGYTGGNNGAETAPAQEQ